MRLEDFSTPRRVSRVAGAVERASGRRVAWQECARCSSACDCKRLVATSRPRVLAASIDYHREEKE